MKASKTRQSSKPYLVQFLVRHDKGVMGNLGSSQQLWHSDRQNLKSCTLRRWGRNQQDISFLLQILTWYFSYRQRINAPLMRALCGCSFPPGGQAASCARGSHANKTWKDCSKEGFFSELGGISFNSPQFCKRSSDLAVARGAASVSAVKIWLTTESGSSRKVGLSLWQSTRWSE